jgi:hypothetical protein
MSCKKGYFPEGIKKLIVSDAKIYRMVRKDAENYFLS